MTEKGIALALGGGAALGWAHIGVLRILEEDGIAVRAIAGTSIGALAALCFAAGKLDVLEAIARGTTSRRVLSYLDPSFSRGGWLGGRRLARELEQHFGTLRLETLPVPIALVAADLDTADEVRMTSGPAVSAVQASMALPGLFRAVDRDGRSLIDGGMVATLPIGAARAIGEGVPVVAVDLLSDYDGHARAARRPRSAPNTLSGAVLMMFARQTQAAVANDPPDVLMTLPVGHIATGAFTRADELIAIGREAASAALPRIRAVVSAQ